VLWLAPGPRQRHARQLCAPFEHPVNGWFECFPKEQRQACCGWLPYIES